MCKVLFNLTKDSRARRKHSINNCTTEMGRGIENQLKVCMMIKRYSLKTVPTILQIILQ